MDTTLFLKGLVIGFSIAAPVGPIGVLCIQRTIAYGKASGLLTGFGAATADGVFGIIAAFGLTVISSFLVGQQVWLSLIGGAFLLYLGIKTFLSKPAETGVKSEHKGLFSDYFSTFFLTLTNPVTILSFIAVFAGLGLGSIDSGDISSATWMVLGVIVGSIAWWFLLSGGVSLFRNRFTPASLGTVNKMSGVIIIAFAILAFVKAAGF